MVTLTFHPNAWSCVVTLTLVSGLCPCSGEMATAANCTDGGDVGAMTKMETLTPAISPGPGHVSGEWYHERIKRAKGTRKTPFTDKEKKVILSKHNKLRSGTKKAADMIMMEWDKDLEKESQMWADRCDFNHPEDMKGVGKFDTYGQNLKVYSSEPSPITKPVQDWYDEMQHYTYSKDNQCGQAKMCRHYTQVVWASSYAVGCAIKYCDVLTSVVDFREGYLVVCNYGPKGNMENHYPYTEGKACSKCPDSFMYCKDNLCSNTPSSGHPLVALHHHPYTLVAMVTTSVTISLATGHNPLF